MAGQGYPELAWLRHGRLRNASSGAIAALPRGLPNARPWMAGQGYPELARLRHGRLRNASSEAIAALPRGPPTPSPPSGVQVVRAPLATQPLSPARAPAHVHRGRVAGEGRACRPPLMAPVPESPASDFPDRFLRDV